MHQDYGPRLRDIFVGDGERAQPMRQHDWVSTSLDHPSDRPNSLTAARQLPLASRFELCLGWGLAIFSSRETLRD